ncbi:hypothetical protein ACQKL5_15100 [Peribacillus sp. NPDC097675]|uniref:hypothetical protein n=1 Tax=Peribacillus sp. NPDC097675 TaxID=3390618 RepID=UPI003D0596A2
MFDPTAFENMKVVLEGAIYDRDLIGDILVIGRDDIVNLSTMARRYKIELEMKESESTVYVTGGFELYASLENLSSELLESNLNEAHSGCAVDLFIAIPRKLHMMEIESISKELENIWGSQRTITLTTSETVSKKEKPSSISTFEISFGRLIKEDQMEDLEDMLEYLLQSLQIVEDSVSN